MDKDRLILEYCRLLANGPISPASIHKAISEKAPEFHLKRLIWDITEAEKFMPDSRERVITVFDGLEEGEEPGEPLTFKYRIEAEGIVTAKIFPGTVEWTLEEKEMMEIIGYITFFYAAKVRFAEMTKKGALTQFLTGLPNSGGFIVRATEYLRLDKLKKYNSFYFNLRGFGMISRRYGVREGDNIIVRYAKKLKEFLLPDEVLGHLGGDNFVALVKKERLKEFLDYISCIMIKAYRNDAEFTVRIMARSGVYEIPDDFHNIGEVIGLPAVALGVARNVTHEPVVFVSEEMLKRVNWQKQIEQMFSPAIRNEEFEVYYQPKVDSRTNELVGAEALVRWFHDGQMIAPGDFIPPLEREGGVALLDFYVLRHVCADIRHWIDEGIEPVPVSVNFSRRDLTNPDLAMQIDEIIRTFGIDRKYIQIEVTETINARENSMMIDFLNRLCELKISTAIDDFGSGFSSLGTLRNFKVNVLKIDRSFINNDVLTERDEIILTDIIHMARNLGIAVITEGVEREDQLEFVNKVGCYMIQGFYYDRPLPKLKFKERLIKRIY